MSEPKITVTPIVHRRHHVDAFTDGPAPPRPRSREARPGLSEKLGPGSFVIPDGAQLEISHTAAGGAGAQQIVLGAGTVRIRQTNAPRAKPRNRYEPGGIPRET